jgi:hypothetical protein
MKQPFDYKVWKNHPRRDEIKLFGYVDKEVTNFTDFSESDSLYCLFGIVDNEVENWTIDGLYDSTDPDDLNDLFMELPGEPEFYVLANLEGSFLDRQIVNAIYTSKETAQFAKGISENQSYKIYKLVKQ